MTEPHVADYVIELEEENIWLRKELERERDERRRAQAMLRHPASGDGFFRVGEVL